jgi:hypothetical protein
MNTITSLKYSCVDRIPVVSTVKASCGHDISCSCRAGRTLIVQQKFHHFPALQLSLQMSSKMAASDRSSSGSPEPTDNVFDTVDHSGYPDEQGKTAPWKDLNLTLDDEWEPARW